MLQKGTVLFNKYLIEKQLGRGGMGSVYLCTNIEIGNKCALKHITNTNGTKFNFAEELILKKLNHAILPRIMDIIYQDYDTYIIESYIEGISLDKKLGLLTYISEEQALKWISDICGQLRYLHELKPMPIIYRDVKPSNIIITPQDTAVLVDFGIAAEKSTKSINLVATLNYAAPEQLNCDNVIDEGLDIYSIGVLLHQLVLGYLPEKERWKRKNYLNISNKTADIIEKCLHNRRIDRYKDVLKLEEDIEKAKKYLLIRNRNVVMLSKVIIGVSLVLTVATLLISIIGFLQHL